LGSWLGGPFYLTGLTGLSDGLKPKNVRVMTYGSPLDGINEIEIRNKKRKDRKH